MHPPPGLSPVLCERRQFRQYDGHDEGRGPLFPRRRLSSAEAWEVSIGAAQIRFQTKVVYFLYETTEWRPDGNGSPKTRCSLQASEDLFILSHSDRPARRRHSQRPMYRCTCEHRDGDNPLPQVQETGGLPSS